MAGEYSDRHCRSNQMNSNSIRSSGPLQYAARVDWAAVGLWLLGFGLVAYLGLAGGGYDPLVHDQVGIVVYWILLAAVLVGAVPRRAPGQLAWAALGLLVVFVAWTGLSLVWSESIDRTWADLARVTGYLGVFALAVLARGPKGTRTLVGAVAAGVVCVAAVALLSRLHPAWFPAADQTGRFVAGGRERLSYPLNYWNALAGLIAIGTPLVLQSATCARSLVVRAASAAALPALALTVFFTLSRAGIAAGLIALALFFVFTSDRLPKLLTLLVVGGGGGLLIVAAHERDALRHGLGDATARHQGDEMLWIVLLTCLAVGAIQAAITWFSRRTARPAWTVPSRRLSQVAAGVGVLAIAVVALTAGAPGRASDAWSEFKKQGPPGRGADRLGSVAGEGRYEFWDVAAKENASKPLTGTGSGTFEFWWSREGKDPQTVRDAHSLYMQTLGELGIVGLALLAAFLLTVLVGGGWIAIRARPPDRPPLAAALAGCAAFCVSATVDWMWQIPALPVAMLLLAAALLSGFGTGDRLRLKLPLRLACAVLALAAITAIAFPLAEASLLRQSQAAVRAGDLPAAMDKALEGQDVLPAAAAPRLQEALVLEAQGSLPAASEAARAATEREAANWRGWFVLARIEAERGRAGAATRAYRRARSLNHALASPAGLRGARA